HRFRADLYFRLNGVTVKIPALRERREYIVPLAQQFLKEATGRAGRAAPVMTPDARASLEAYAWPGNVRELRNVMQRAALLAIGRRTLIDKLDQFALPRPRKREQG